MTTATQDPRAWTAETVDRPETWYFPLPRRFLDLLQTRTAERRPTTELRLTGEERATFRRELADVRHALVEGRGFAILHGLPETCAPAEAQAAYWLAGQALGEPFEQNVQGTLLYDVRDTGQDLSQGARFSVTSYESSFHTDNSFGETVLDYVGLLCLQPAKAGGINYIVSGLSVVHVLHAQHPEALAELCRPFHVDRRGGVREGQEPTVRMPVIERSGPDVLIRYLRYWIEVGHEKASEPLTAAQVAALDTLDAVLRRPDLRAEFALRRGEMLFLNNRWLLHNRTAFEDHAQLERRRHLVRLWLRRTAENGR